MKVFRVRDFGPWHKRRFIYLVYIAFKGLNDWGTMKMLNGHLALIDDSKCSLYGQALINTDYDKASSSLRPVPSAEFP